MMLARGRIFLAFGLQLTMSCSAHARAEESSGSWITTPSYEEYLERTERGSRVPDECVYLVRAKAIPSAAERLRGRSIEHLDAATALSMVDEGEQLKLRSMLTLGGYAYLVRGVETAPGGFMVIRSGDTLWISHDELDDARLPKAQPLVVLLATPPERVHVRTRSVQ